MASPALDLGDIPPRTWDGVIETAGGHAFPDGSLGRDVWFSELTARQADEPLTGDTPPSALVGLVVELRTFDDGEILAIDHLEHWIGPPRFGDTLIPMWTALSPHVPDLEPGSAVSQRSNLPLLLDGGLGMVLGLDLDWTLVEDPPLASLPPSWHIRYEGSMRGRGADRGDRWAAREALNGHVSGDLWLARADHGVVKSEFVWDLELSIGVTDVASGTSRERLVQRQHHEGSLLRLDAPDSTLPAWLAQARRPYPTADEVLGTLHAAGPQLSSCMSGAPDEHAPWAAKLDLGLHQDGRVIGAGVQSTDVWDEAARCLERTACGLRFPPGAEPGARWSYTVAWSHGAVQSYPTVEGATRSRGPLLLASPDPAVPRPSGYVELFGLDAPAARPASALPPCSDERTSPEQEAASP